MDLTTEILGCPSVPGASEKMTAIIKNELEKYGCNFTTDALSNAFFTKKHGEGRHLTVCCGIDIGGVIATDISGSKIYISALGNCKNIQTVAYSKVVFEGASGILIPPDGYTSSTNVSDCHVETYDNSVCQKVQPGAKGYLDIPLNSVDGRIIWGYGAGEKMCIKTAVSAAAMLFSHEGKKLCEEYGIGTVTAAFLGQHSLLARGSAVAANTLCPDEIILLSPFDLGKEEPKYKYAVKVSDKNYTADDLLLQNVCKYFDKHGISYKKTVSKDRNIAAVNLSHAPSSPQCIEIGLAVYHTCAVINQ